MSIPTRQPRGDGRGMTLVEILVVLVIIASMAAITVLSVGLAGTDREIERESSRLADGIALLQEQAQLEGRDYGLRIESSSYEFLRYSAFDLRWDPVEGDPGLRPQELPPGLAFELVIEGRPILLRRAERPEARLPQIVAYGGGENTPYQLTIGRRDATRITLIGAADGTIEIRRDDAP